MFLCERWLLVALLPLVAVSATGCWSGSKSQPVQVTTTQPTAAQPSSPAQTALIPALPDSVKGAPQPAEVASADADSELGTACQYGWNMARVVVETLTEGESVEFQPQRAPCSSRIGRRFP